MRVAPGQWFDEPDINASGKEPIKAKHLSLGGAAARCCSRNAHQYWGMESMASGNDMKSDNESYDGFIGLVKWGTVSVAIIAAFVVFVIA